MGRNYQTQFVCFFTKIETCRIPSKKPDVFSELIEVEKFWFDLLQKKNRTHVLEHVKVCS